MKRILIIAGLTAVAVWMYKKSTEIRQYEKTNEKGSTAIISGRNHASYLRQNINQINSGIAPRSK